MLQHFNSKSVWSLVQLQYAFVSFDMCGLGYLSKMLLTILSVRVSLLYRVLW